MLLTLFAFALLLALAITEPQLWLITIVLVPVIGEILRILSVKLGYKPTKFTMMLILSVLSVVLAAIFNLSLFQTLPPMADGFLPWLGALVFIVGELIGVAKIIYDAIWDKLFDILAKAGISFLSYRLPSE